MLGLELKEFFFLKLSFSIKSITGKHSKKKSRIVFVLYFKAVFMEN